MEEKQKKAFNPKAVIIIIILLLCIGGGVGAFAYNMLKDKKPVTTVSEERLGDGSGIVITEDNLGSAKDVVNKAENGQIVIKMTGNWLFTDGCTKSNAYIGNSEYNSFPLKFVITMADTNEVLMTSPEVPVGSCIKEFPLSVKLDPGTYSVVVSHQKIIDGKPYSAVNTAATIVVQ